MTILTVLNNNDSGAGSLRDLIASATGGDTIVFDASMAGLTITLTSGELALSKNLTIDGDIDGDDKADVSISGNNISRVFNITGSETDVTLKSLTMHTGRAAAGDGGVILADDIASLTLIDSTVKWGFASGVGGGVDINAVNFNVVNSAIYASYAAIGGGGINSDVTNGYVVNSTISNNFSGDNGSGIQNIGSLDIYNSTVSLNHTNLNTEDFSEIGGVVNLGTLNLYNTVVAGNSATNSSTNVDFGGNDITNASNSFIGSSASIINNVNTTTNGGDAGLGYAIDNGGTVNTMAIIQDSVLIGGGGCITITK